MKIHPLPGYILIIPVDDDEGTAGGLLLPEKAKEKPGKGRVVDVGDPIVHYESPASSQITNTAGSAPPLEYCVVKKGDIVIYHKWAGNEIKDVNKNVVLVKFADLQGVYV